MESLKEKILDYIRKSNKKCNRVLLIVAFRDNYKQNEIENCIIDLLESGVIIKDRFSYFNLTKKYWDGVKEFSGFVDRTMYVEFFHPENLIINHFKENDIVVFVNNKGTMCVGKVININKTDYKDYSSHTYDISSLYSQTVFKDVMIQQILKPLTKCMDVNLEIKKVKSKDKIKL